MHNLRSVDVDIPHARLVVVTGCSGSGKSSLVFDTIFAEGRRQYLETLSLRARQLFRQVERPDVDLIDGLQPTICIDQFPTARNPRATVATASELHDYFRVLFARAGTPYCPTCHQPIAGSSLEEIQADLMRLAEETRVILLAPHLRNSGEGAESVLEEFRSRGYLRARVDGTLIDLDEPRRPLDPDQPHTVELVVDRIIMRGGIEKRLAESIRAALDNPYGQLVALIRGRKESAWTERRYASRLACPDCGFALEGIEPRHFNPASPYGACPDCEGLGMQRAFALETLWSDPTSAFRTQPIATLAPQIAEALETYLEKLKLSKDTPLAELPASAKRKIWHGCGRPKFPGLETLVNQFHSTLTDAAKLEELESILTEVPCGTCAGSGLSEAGRCVRLSDQSLPELLNQTIGEAASWFERLELPSKYCGLESALLEPIRSRLAFLCQVGVHYLSLARRADTLSGGELQRIRLANAIGTSLSGVCYVLDEPSIGLHPRDNERLIASLKHLASRGNTVIVVEHDPAIIAAADYMVDLGPGAGPSGGRVVACGTVEDVTGVPESPTGAFLRGERSVSSNRPRRSVEEVKWLELRGAATHNLREIDVSIPLGRLVCVTGVSGSGKSSLIHGTLEPAVRQALGDRRAVAGPFASLTGAERIAQLVGVDQSPIGRSSRSTPATYTGIFDEIRKLFAQTKGARQRGFTARRFSFNHTAGRCEACRGHGVRRIEMGMLADLHVVCARCGGRRVNRQTLQVRYRHQTIADVLEMSVAEAVEFFSEIPRIRLPLERLAEIGLGYLRLGQPAHTLSGGEAQRVKLATELAKPARGHVLYLLDEPTTGLHLADIQMLLQALQQLVDQGHTVVVIEHQLDLIQAADWVIDLGPEGGERGGRVVVAGPPETVARCSESITGRYLQSMFATKAW